MLGRTRRAVRMFAKTVGVAAGRQLQSSSTKHVFKSIAAVGGGASVALAACVAGENNTRAEAEDKNVVAPKKYSHLTHPAEMLKYKSEILAILREKTRDEIVMQAQFSISELATIIIKMKDKRQQYELIQLLEPVLKYIFMHEMTSQYDNEGTCITRDFNLFENDIQKKIFSTLGEEYVNKLVQQEEMQVISETGRLTFAKLIAIMHFAGVYNPDNYSAAVNFDFDSQDKEALQQLLEAFQSHHAGQPYSYHAAFIQALIDNADKAKAIHAEFTSKEYEKKPLSEKLTAEFIESLAKKVSENKMAPSAR